VRADQQATPATVTELRIDEDPAPEKSEGVKLARSDAGSASLAGRFIHMGEELVDAADDRDLRLEEEVDVRLLDVAIEELDRPRLGQGERQRNGDRRLARPAFAAGDGDSHRARADPCS
jgi:hypothetical protein